MTTHTTLRRSCTCDEPDRCSDCRARAEEARAARRDAVLHRLASTRPRRAVL